MEKRDWRYEQLPGSMSFRILSGWRDIVGTVFCQDRDDYKQAKENAKLIANSPELLECLTKIVECYKSNPFIFVFKRKKILKEFEKAEKIINEIIK